mmetsp:Transcript_32256/g.74267  ORF Transcript_32256/g.74267 Transcript_32256/m.74267 type:complete len:466 (-) Transcript_32256:397-1794(-)
MICQSAIVTVTILYLIWSVWAIWILSASSKKGKDFVGSVHKLLPDRLMNSRQGPPSEGEKILQMEQQKLAIELAATLKQRKNFEQKLKQLNENGSGSIELNNALNPTINPTFTFKRKSTLAPECTPLKPEEVHYTLVTQVSTERVWMLKHHCKRWKGPISIAAFTNRSIADIHNEITVHDGCDTGQVHIQTVNSDGVEEGEYPVNTLRNLALSVVQTSHVVYLDIDFWQSTNSLEILNFKYVREELADDDRLAIVIPAFQLARQCGGEDLDGECEQRNIQKMPQNKLELGTLVKAHEASPFDPTNRGGHGSTEYGHWFKQRRAQFHDLPCIRSNRYEPYMAFRYCRDFPPFQEQFTGYGKNKMSQIMQMRRNGYIFSQLGDIFVTHYPHSNSKARKMWNKVPKKSGGKHEEENFLRNSKRAQVDRIFVEFKKWLMNNITDLERVHLCADAEDDDKRLWWPLNKNR